MFGSVPWSELLFSAFFLGALIFGAICLLSVLSSAWASNEPVHRASRIHSAILATALLGAAWYLWSNGIVHIPDPRLESFW
jgi:hypothetical protein